MPYHERTNETVREFDEAWKEFVAKNKITLPASQKTTSRA